MNATDPQIFQIEDNDEESKAADSTTKDTAKDDLIREAGGGESSTPTGSTEDEDESLPNSSADNIIPLENLRNGWFAVSKFLASTCSAVQERAIEAYSSEPVQNFRTKTADVVMPAWERTREGAGYAVEKTQENFAIIGENMKPTVDEIATSAKAGWESFAAAATVAAVYTAERVDSFAATLNGDPATQVDDEDGSNSSSVKSATGASAAHPASAVLGEEYTPSALNQATKGGPMQV